MTLPEESRDVDCKSQEFGVVWCIPFEMTAKSARGGPLRTPPPSINRVKLHLV